jgi:competence protein ComEC
VLVRADSVLPPDPSLGARLRWGPTRWREALAERLEGLYGPRAPLVSALVLARREGLDRELRQGFARAGIAHLLAISGFHVGVVAGLVYALLRALSVGRRRAAGWAAGATWAYVALLGFPDAASRAAVILTLVSVARVRGRPAARWSPLGAAFLLLVLLDPARVASVGFQLSFLGAAGLVAGRAPLEARLSRVGRGRLPRWLVDGVSAGAAATAATLPAVAWHFEEVSVVGIPATLAASPLVSLALPGALASLLLEPVAPGPAAFLAGGVDTLLLLLSHGTERVGALPWAAVWIPREWTALAGIGAGGAWIVARSRGAAAGSRRLASVSWAAALVLGWPLLLVAAGRGTLEIRILDVGQGDAIALRTPRGRWVLVDAGPPWEGRGPGPVVGPLRRLGVHRLEALVFTHPDADHVGGGVDVLQALEVGAVLDPGVATGKEGYVDLLEEAMARGVPWRRARAPLEWTIDDVTIQVLHPGAAPDARSASNELSVVLLVRWGRFEALLTGDASRAVERALLPELPRGGLELLKVGHHGSDTSTDSLLLAHTAPGVAVISAGRDNRYGHPALPVLRRLSAAGVPVRRTDRDGTIRVQARSDGSFRVWSAGRWGP